MKHSLGLTVPVVGMPLIVSGADVEPAALKQLIFGIFGIVSVLTGLAVLLSERPSPYED